MPTHVYLVPKIGDGLTISTAFRPKYTDIGSLGGGWDISGRWTSLDYGAESAFLLIANLAPSEHTDLNAQTDVLAFPDLDTQVSSVAVSTIQSKLQSARVPAEWVSTTLTYRQVCKIVRKIISYMQRYYGAYGDSIFAGGLTLDTRVNQIPAQRRSRLADAATGMGLSVVGITGTTTIRQALKIFADQLPDQIIGGENL